MSINNQAVLTAYNTSLSLQAGWLIGLGMFDADGGRYSGLLAAYKDAIGGISFKTSYVLFPDKGIAILVDNQFNLYVHSQYRKQGIAKRLTEIFIEQFPSLIIDKPITSQSPTTEILNNLLNACEMQK